MALTVHNNESISTSKSWQSDKKILKNRTFYAIPSFTTSGAILKVIEARLDVILARGSLGDAPYLLMSTFVHRMH